jgi:hypothetical protein
MQARAALAAGVLGSTSLHLVHESARHWMADAPHMDLIGMRAVGKGLRRLGMRPLSVGALRKVTLVADLVSNSLYYSLVAGLGRSTRPRSAWMRGLALGVLAGVGAVVLPPRLGLARQTAPQRTAALTFCWYLIGGVVAAAAFNGVSKAKRI